MLFEFYFVSRFAFVKWRVSLIVSKRHDFQRTTHSQNIARICLYVLETDECATVWGPYCHFCTDLTVSCPGRSILASSSSSSLFSGTTSGHESFSQATHSDNPRLIEPVTASLAASCSLTQRRWPARQHRRNIPVLSTFSSLMISPFLKLFFHF